MILQSQISKLSNRLLKEQGGRRIPESILERDYCIAWFLVGLSQTTLCHKLIFKGGTALRRCYFADYRFSEDLDFTLLEPLSFDEIKIELEAVYSIIKKKSNIDFRFSRVDPTSHQNSYTFYLAYEGPLPTTTPKEIKVDITLKEKIFFKPVEMPVLKTYEEFTDLPKEQKITVYSLLEIVTEKIMALLDKARTEPRDLYDLWYLIENNDIDLTECTTAILVKLEYKGKTLVGPNEIFQKKEIRLKKTWDTRLYAQMTSLPEFEHVYRSVKRAFRQAGII
jgi:predicted nucleotidyltransferase component of viral defense system